MFRTLLVLTVLCLVLTACTPVRATPPPLPVAAVPAQTPTQTPMPPTPAPAPAAPTPPNYGERGDYRVDVLYAAAGEGGEQLDLAVAYPKLRSSSGAAPGPFPLVVFAVGLGGSRYDPLPFLEDIASHGFVVMTWTPRGETDAEFWAGAATRPLDLQRMLDYAAELAAPGGKLAGLIDMDKIAITGGSSGGWNALEGGGAQMDLGFCDQADLVAQLPESNCPQFVPHQQEIAAMLGLPAVPQGLWPPTNDPRVDAVIAIAPDGDLWGANYEGVAGVKVPTFVMAGSKDRTNVPELCAYPIYDHLGSSDKALAIFDGADHDMAWEKYAQPIEHLFTAFLLAHLKGDPAAAAALLPANVNFPGVTYKRSAQSAESAAPALAGKLLAELGLPHTYAENGGGGHCDYPWATESLQFLWGTMDF